MAYGLDTGYRFVRGAIGLPVAFILTSLVVSAVASAYEMATDVARTGEVPIDKNDLPDANESPKDTKIELAVDPRELQYKFYGVLALLGGVANTAFGKRK